MNVIDISIVVIVDPIPGDLSRIRVNIVSQVGVINVDACIGDGHHYARTSSSYSPGFLSVNVRARRRYESINRITPIQQSPLPLEVGVVRPKPSEFDQPVWFGVFDF